MGTYNDKYKISTSDLINILHPVGSVYISTNSSFDPAAAWGGSWEQLSSGKALWTASSGAGDTIGAGLPNITGSMNAQTNTAYVSSGDGVFYGEATTDDHHGYTGSGYPTRNIHFNASSYNSGIYGKSSTVQPPAYKVYAWRRTA